MTEVEDAASASVDLLRFAILDEEDLAVMSAHLQDAHIKLADAAYLADSKRFVVVGSRIDWSAMAHGRQERRRTGFHFEHVSRVRRSGFDQTDPEKHLQLLAISHQVTDAPSAEILLTFAGGNLIKLDVACLDAEMRDLSGGWPVKDCPKHRLDAAQTQG